MGKGRDIHIISNITLKDGYVFTNKSIFHRKQGAIDGACSIYCLMMLLLHLDYIEEQDLEYEDYPDKRTPKGKLLNELLENKGLMKGGYSLVKLKKDIENQCCNELLVERFSPRTQDKIVDKIADLIDEDLAPIFLVNWEITGGHFLLGIGYETDDKGRVTKILCMDPDGDEPQVSYWNCYLDVSKLKGDFPVKYVSINNLPSKCKLGDLLTVEKKS